MRAMRRGLLWAAAGVLCLAQQYSREDVHAAYRAWREADPALEREAAAGGAPIARRADRLSAEASKYEAGRKALLDSVARGEAEQVSLLQSAAIPAETAAASAAADAQFLAAENARLNRMINAFAGTSDRGIQRLRQALERERTALGALSAAVVERQRAMLAVAAGSDAAELARTKALDQMRPMLEAANEASADPYREAAAWTEYYRKLGEGAEGEAKPITVVPPGVEAVTLNNPAPAPPTVTPLPLVRYVGEWTFPTQNGVFHGIQPEMVDVVVTEANGQAKGTLTARFKLPEGNIGDPALQFEFSGPFQPTRNQVFHLVTSNGVKGRVELIPGSAFNLLEVRFQTESNPTKIRLADMVLVKK